MEALAIIGSVALIHLLAVMSPGPDLIMCIRSALSYSRRTGIWTAIGFGAGISVHILYSLAGIALIISQSILIFNAIKYLGAMYLVYIGIKSLLSRSRTSLDVQKEKKTDISAWEAFKMGFFTNVLNPKATLFFLSLFTLVLSPETPFWIMLIASLVMVIDTIVWFSLVSIFLTQSRVQKAFVSFEGFFNKTFGALLVALGVKVAMMEK